MSISTKRSYNWPSSLSGPRWYISKLLLSWSNNANRWRVLISRYHSADVIINYNMIVVFFGGVDRFIAVVDWFIPIFHRFIPASIPVIGVLPLSVKCTIINNVFISFMSFYLKWIFLIKKYTSITRIQNLFNNTAHTNPRLTPSNFIATDCWLWSTGSDRRQSSVVNSMLAN